MQVVFVEQPLGLVDIIWFLQYFSLIVDIVNLAYLNKLSLPGAVLAGNLYSSTATISSDKNIRRNMMKLIKAKNFSLQM